MDEISQHSLPDEQNLLDVESENQPKKAKIVRHVSKAGANKKVSKKVVDVEIKMKG